MKATISETRDQELAKPGTHFWPGYPIVVERVENFTGWKYHHHEPWTDIAHRVHLRATYPDGVVHHVIVYCPADLFRVARETHVL